MSLRRASAALLIVSAVLAGAPAASAQESAAPVSTTLSDPREMEIAYGVGTGAKSWLCTHLGLFC